MEREGGTSSYEVYPESSAGFEAREVEVRVGSFTLQITLQSHIEGECEWDNLLQPGISHL